MTNFLETSTVKSLVTERAGNLGDDITPDEVEVIEDPYSNDGATLVVRIAARRPVDRGNWILRRSRFSQAIRDALVERGDERYPLIQIFEPEEWSSRDD